MKFNKIKKKELNNDSLNVTSREEKKEKIVNYQV